MPIQKTCPSCTKSTTIMTRDGAILPNQRCDRCGFRLPDYNQRNFAKSSEFGD